MYDSKHAVKEANIWDVDRPDGHFNTIQFTKRKLSSVIFSFA